MGKGHPSDILSFVPVGSHTELAIATAQTLTPPAHATKIMMQAIEKNLRYTVDGTVPTTTKGFRLTAGEYIIFPLAKSNVIKVIEESATCDFQYQWGR